MESIQVVTTKGKLNPTDNKIQISNKKSASFFIFLSKIFLEKYEEIELHALGQATTVAIRVAENLSRFKYTEIIKIESKTISGQGEGERQSKKVKMIVKLKRNPDFFEMIKTTKK